MGISSVSLIAASLLATPRGAALSLSRRDALRGAAASALVVPAASFAAPAPAALAVAPSARAPATTTQPVAKPVARPTANVTEALQKNKMTVRRRESLLTELVIDRVTGDEVRQIRLPRWWPKKLRPPRRLARRVGDGERGAA